MVNLGRERHGGGGKPTGEVHGSPRDLGLATARPEPAPDSLLVRAMVAGTPAMAAPARRAVAMAPWCGWQWRPSVGGCGAVGRKGRGRRCYM